MLEVMLRLGQEATLEMLWLYERYSVPNAGRGGMTKCQADHFGRDRGRSTAVQRDEADWRSYTHSSIPNSTLLRVVAMRDKDHIPRVIVATNSALGLVLTVHMLCLFQTARVK